MKHIHEHIFSTQLGISATSITVCALNVHTAISTCTLAILCHYYSATNHQMLSTYSIRVGRNKYDICMYVSMYVCIGADTCIYKMIYGRLNIPPTVYTVTHADTLICLHIL